MTITSFISSSCPEDIWMTEGQYDECLATVPNLKVLVLPKGVGIVTVLCMADYPIP